MIPLEASAEHGTAGFVFVLLDGSLVLCVFTSYAPTPSFGNRIPCAILCWKYITFFIKMLLGLAVKRVPQFHGHSAFILLNTVETEGHGD